MFELQKYQMLLQTVRLGRPCLYFDKIDSTINEAFKHPPGTLIIAGQQNKGRGQGTNVWASPVGCAMGSVKILCPKLSYLAKRITFLQHIVGLAILQVLERYDDDNLGKSKLKLKWPNDIIYLESESKTKHKIGGILVNSEDSLDCIEIVLSFGVNISNEEPTTCVNKITPNKPMTIYYFVAKLMWHLESYLTDLDSGLFEQIKREYTERCMNMNCELDDINNGRMLIYGVNDDGYLCGKRLLDNKACIVQKITSY